MRPTHNTIATLAFVAAAWALPACRAPAQIIPVSQESRPDDLLADVRVEARWSPSEYVTSIWITNVSDQTIEISPGNFILEDTEGRPLAFGEWAYFGGTRFTSYTPRPLWPRYSTYGWIRWYPGWAAPASLLRVNLGDQEQTFRIESPTPAPSAAASGS